MTYLAKSLSIVALILCLAGGWTTPAIAQTEPAAVRTMPVEDVRIGMKGYGLTVFKGTQIEPFPVEVISIVGNSSPGRSVVWIRCPDQRMQKNGPVQGMSGSPIFLWSDNEPHELGKGGRLIGAFAFGFALSKDCLVGVQPIEYMRQTAQRAADLRDQPETTQPQARAIGGQTLARLQQLAMAENASAFNMQRLRAYAKLLSLDRHNLDALATAPQQPLPAAPTPDGSVTPLLLPMNVGSPRIARLFTPLLEPLGITPVATAEGLVSSAPPPSIDPDTAKLEHGSVLAIPLVFGDLDLSASGTVTDVLADGTVMAFGHAMFGQGPTAMPMATGFVHFVVPRLSTSFKMGGSLRLKGSIVADEMAAVAGIEGKRYQTAPASITVDMPPLKPQTYNYQIVDHLQMTPTLAAIVTLQSLGAVHTPSPESTLYLSGDLTFTGNRKLKIDTMIPGSSTTDVVFEMLPSIAMAMQNPHQALKLTNMELAARIEPGLQVGTLVDARLDKTEVTPGESINITLWIQPYGKPIEQRRASLKIPAGTPEGDYPLFISSAQSYLGQIMMSRPHLFATRTVDDLMETMQQMLAVRRDMLYLTLQLPEQGIAIGREELPQLPSSRRAMIFTPTSTQAMPYMETAETKVSTDLAMDGELVFNISVRRSTTGATLMPPKNQQPF